MSLPFKFPLCNFQHLFLGYTSNVTFSTICSENSVQIKYTFHCANQDTEEGDLYFNWSDQLAGKGIAKLTVNESEREMGKLFALKEINDGSLPNSDEQLKIHSGWLRKYHPQY